MISVRKAAMKKPRLIILTGPTSAGKTNLSVMLAKEIGGAVVSADSMQVYKHMDIGSGKISSREMQGVEHYLLDVLEPTEEFNVVRFQQMAQEAITKIFQDGKIPILAGGTGFYIQSVLYEIDFTSQADDMEYRRQLEELAKKEGSHVLHEMLRQVDEVSAGMIHENNIKRVIRALEYYRFTGEKISEHNRKERQKASPYDFYYFVLTDERQKLYERIEKRVDDMLEQGLVEEVKQLVESGCIRGMTSMQGLGYKEILDYLEGNISLEEAVYRIKRDTRHFAKRQLTWFKRERDVIWLDRQIYKSDEMLLKKMLAEMDNKK